MNKPNPLSLAPVAFCFLVASNVACRAQAPAQWQPAGWGGGGFYWSTVFHPAKNGVIYMGGDVAGVYKSEDHGKNWRLINTGLPNYAVYSIAIDKANPSVVYAATESGLSRSADEGEHWQLLPQTGPKELRLTGERNKTIRSVAVFKDVIYAASPAGKICKSTDAGQTWKVVYEVQQKPEFAGTRLYQFGKVNDAYFGGFWCPITQPADIDAADYRGVSLEFAGGGAKPVSCFLTLTLKTGAKYRSKNLNEAVLDTNRRDIQLRAADFIVDPDYAKKVPDAPAAPDFSALNRIDFACSGALPTQASNIRLGKLSILALKTADGKTGTEEAPIQVPVKDFSSNAGLMTYGNLRAASIGMGPIYSVAINPKNPDNVIAASDDVGLVATKDAGTTWAPLKTPAQATTVAISAADPTLIYAGFKTEGIYKSTDSGTTWTKTSNGIPADVKIVEIAPSPANPQDVYAIGAIGWGGRFFYSHDGGANWTASNTVAADTENDPTRDLDPKGNTPLSVPTNLAINSLNPKELYISANWRCVWSEDGGVNWQERDKGADISVVTDVRFLKDKTYVSVMDEGSFVSDSAGKSWRQLWPLKWSPELSGHNWRIAPTEVDGKTRVISTLSPWDVSHTPGVIVSEDDGKTFKLTRDGLPNYIVRPNTMWGQGHPRALAVDPNDPSIIYLGLDGDAETGKSGGGIFKSVDGGKSWKQLPNQPASRRMFNGLAVDPTDSKRLFWGACGTNGGLHRSEDGGETWKNVFTNEQWVFNMMVAPDGTVYAAGSNLWRSTDHGNTWKKLTNISGRTIIGIEVDPANPGTMWISAVTWDASSNGEVYKTTDSGATWQNFTGNLPYSKPLILRLNPTTRELWAAGVGLFKIKQ